MDLDYDSTVEMSAEELGKEMDAQIAKESVNTNVVLDRLRFKPRNKSKLNIPLCRMKPLAAVRTHLRNDVMALGSHFISTGYMDGHGVFYVALQDDEGRIHDVTTEDRRQWSPLWQKANDVFEEELKKEDCWQQFSGKMFHVWDGNHRLAAWMPIINRDHGNDPIWHYAVESIVLEVEGQVGPLLTALHQVNWYASNVICLYVLQF